MNKLIVLGFFLLTCFPLAAQQVIKGIPEDLASSEIIIVSYQPTDLIPAEAKSHAVIYQEITPLKELCLAANLQLQVAAKNNFPLAYRIIPKEILADLKLADAYIFEPGKLYGSSGPWSSVPFYIRHAASGQVFEIGYLPKNAIFSAEKVMQHFIEFLPKNLPVQASEEGLKK